MVDELEHRLSELGASVFCPPVKFDPLLDPIDPRPVFAGLWRIPDPPLALFCWGDASLSTKPSIAIVGSRQCSAVGSAVAREMAEELAGAGFVVVSGLARGIDAAAHEGALKGGATGAILGSGFDHIYPPEHRSLVGRIRRSGYVLSEYPPGARALGFHFPERNRLISGLCQAVVVVEASQRSGSLITARLALEQGRDVMAVPGSVRSPLARGCHRLIREGAALVECAQDVLDALGLPGIVRTPVKTPETRELSSGPSEAKHSAKRRPQPATGEDAAILAALDSTPLPLDLIAAHAGLSPHRVAARLLELELVGVVLQVTEGFLRLE
jgi:DNA processing protein